MNQVMTTIFGVIFRTVLFAAGLVFMASLLTISLLVLTVWLVRAVVARLSGRPVRPWTFEINRRTAMWPRFNRASASARPRKRDESTVIDVEPREIKSLKD